MTPQQARKEYLLQRVPTASPVELVRILHEAATESVVQALASLRGGDIFQRGQAITKAIEILSELRLSLRREVNPQYCDMLAGLYGYMQRQLIRAHAEQSESILQEVARLLETLLAGWAGAAESKASEPVTAGTEQPEQPLSGPNPYSSELPDVAPGRSWQL